MSNNLQTNSQPAMTPTVALVYDRVNTRYGGAEHVLKALHQAFPRAPLFTSLYDQSSTPWANNFTVIPSGLSTYMPWLRQSHRLLAPFMPLIFESHNLSSFDIVISITSAEAKGVITLPHQLHVCYLLTPTRYLYSHRDDHEKILSSVPFGRWLGQKLLAYLTWWDQAAQARPDYYLPISELVATRASLYYPRAKVLKPLYPPVKVAPSLPQPTVPFTELAQQLGGSTKIRKNNYAVIVSRLVSYKQISVAIEGCILANKTLVIVGNGPEEKLLKSRYKSNPNIIFVGIQSMHDLRNVLLYSHVVLMPAEEDFGITALDALAHGKPIILHQKSGAAELLKFPQHGQTLTETTPSAIKEALQKIQQTHFDPLKLYKHVQQYNTDLFIKTFKLQVEKLWRRHYVTP